MEMRFFQRRPRKADWSAVESEGKKHHVDFRKEAGMEEKLEALKNRWASEEPDEEFSLMLGTGELVYVGRYPEGVVLRLNDDEDQITFLTEGMAEKLGLKLLRDHQRQEG